MVKLSFHRAVACSSLAACLVGFAESGFDCFASGLPARKVATDLVAKSFRPQLDGRVVRAGSKQLEIGKSGPGLDRKIEAFSLLPD